MERMSKRIHTVYLLLILNFLVYNINVCFAQLEHRCTFDKLNKKYAEHPVHIVREVPKKGQGSWQAFTTSTTDEWAPIRILVSKEDLNDANRYCTLLGQHRPTFTGGNGVCSQDHILTSEKKTILEETIPLAVKLHTDRLLVKPIDGYLPVPNFPSHRMCSQFTIPASHHSPGILNYDMVLYAAAGPSLSDTTAAWALSCAYLTDGRPVVGVIYFAPEKIIKSLRLVRVAAHEMAHALGFFATFFEDRNMITVKQNVRGKRSVSMISTPTVINNVKKHYNCQKNIGMELEDEGGEGTSLSHWERRNAKDELMSPAVEAGYYTSITMSVFEDLGFYRANFSMAEPMSWGYKAGCDFLEKKCVDEGKSKFPNMFCDTVSSKYLCTSDRLALGTCGIYTHKQRLPSAYQYFKDRQTSGSMRVFTDYCPVIDTSKDTFCSGETGRKVRGSRVGLSSWCLKGDSLYYENSLIGDICAEVKCDNEIVKIRYLDDDEWYPCPEGDYLIPKKTFNSGRIVCPNYTEVCTIASDGSSRVNKMIKQKEPEEEREERPEKEEEKEEEEPEDVVDSREPAQTTVNSDNDAQEGKVSDLNNKSNLTVNNHAERGGEEEEEEEGERELLPAETTNSISNSATDNNHGVTTNSISNSATDNNHGENTSTITNISSGITTPQTREGTSVDTEEPLKGNNPKDENDKQPEDDSKSTTVSVPTQTVPPKENKKQDEVKAPIDGSVSAAILSITIFLVIVISTMISS